jgi:hypothetical protein
VGENILGAFDWFVRHGAPSKLVFPALTPQAAKADSGARALCGLSIHIASLITLAMLNIEPPGPKNSGSNADDPISLDHLLGMLHIVDLNFDLKPEWLNN